MKEERFTELMAKKLSGEISDDELADFVRLTDSDVAFQKEYETLKAYWAEEDEPDENTDRVFADIKRRTGLADTDNVVEMQPAKSKRLWPLRIVAAASVLILISVGYYFINLKRTPDALVALTELKTGNGAIKNIKLADGTSVTLNAASVLRYPASFSGKTREVYLEGEGFFDVAKDHQHPFIVHTKESDIQVLGTAFNIKSYAADSVFEATLFRGSIQASVKNNAGRKVLLKPSDKLVIEANRYFLTHQTHLGVDTTNIETAWMHKKIIFKDQPFGLLANSLSRKYGVNIFFDRKSLKTIKLTGEFDKENIDQVLYSLKVVAKFDYKNEGNGIYIY